MPDTHLVFPGPIPSGEWTLAPCGQLTFTLWDVAGLLGILCRGWTLCQRASSTRADIGVAVGGPSARVFGPHARCCVAIRLLLRRHCGFELEILFCYSHRFLRRHYIMFERGGMAFNFTAEQICQFCCLRLRRPK